MPFYDLFPTLLQIYDPLLKGILSIGVKMCWGFGVADVHMSQTGFLNSIELKRSAELLPKPARRGQHNSDHDYQETKSADEPLYLACMALLCCTTCVCDRDVFSAVVDSGLVFDGGLVVDPVSCFLRYKVILACLT